MMEWMTKAAERYKRTKMLTWEESAAMRRLFVLLIRTFQVLWCSLKQAPKSSWIDICRWSNCSFLFTDEWKFFCFVFCFRSEGTSLISKALLMKSTMMVHWLGRQELMKVASVRSRGQLEILAFTELSKVSSGEGMKWVGKHSENGREFNALVNQGTRQRMKP